MKRILGQTILHLVIIFFYSLSIAEYNTTAPDGLPLVSANNKSKVSIIIPCYHAHAIHLFDLLKNYEKQSCIPDEVVISLSEYTKVDTDLLHKIDSEKWAFPVKMLMTDNRLYAGENRNIAASNATGDILICQDADDLPHPQRTEIVRYFFENYDIDFLLHQYQHVLTYDTTISFGLYDNLEKVKYVYPRNFSHAFELGITNGNICIRKKVFLEHKWSPMKVGQDSAYNNILFLKYPKRIVLLEPLLIYRNYLTSGLLGRHACYQLENYSGA